MSQETAEIELRALYGLDPPIVDPRAIAAPTTRELKDFHPRCQSPVANDELAELVEITPYPVAGQTALTFYFCCRAHRTDLRSASVGSVTLQRDRSPVGSRHAAKFDRFLERTSTPMTTAKVHCQICGRLPEDGTHSVAITVPTTDYRGKALQVPGVHFACRNCRQAIAVAEREQKRKRKEEGKGNADR